MAKKEFIEAAQKKHPQYSAQAIEQCVLTAFLSKAEIKELFSFELGRNAYKLAKMGSAILVSELDETVESFPRLSQEQVLRWFKREALVGPEVKLDSTGITRPMLIELVEALEDYTGLQLSDEKNLQAPLRYLDEISQTLTIEDVAEYFSGSPSRIMSIRTKDRKGLPPMSGKTQTYQRSAVKSYLNDCCGGEVNEGTPVANLCCVDVDNPYVIVHWMENRFGKMIDNAVIKKGTVKDLLDAFVAN